MVRESGPSICWVDRVDPPLSRKMTDLWDNSKTGTSSDLRSAAVRAIGGAAMVYLEILLVLGLVVLNGVLAMSELAVVSSRPGRLKAMRATRGTPFHSPGSRRVYAYFPAFHGSHSSAFPTSCPLRACASRAKPLTPSRPPYRRRGKPPRASSCFSPATCSARSRASTRGWTPTTATASARATGSNFSCHGMVIQLMYHCRAFQQVWEGLQ